MNRAKQVSESLTLGIFLALAGGFMDAYSYECRGEVFANAQTGNILLFGIHISKGEFPMALRYLCPILAFALGIVVSDVVKHYLKEKKLPHWRQVTILFEAVVLVAVGFMAQKYNLLANSMTVEFDEYALSTEGICSAVEKAGYGAFPKSGAPGAGQGTSQGAAGAAVLSEMKGDKIIWFRLN